MGTWKPVVDTLDFDAIVSDYKSGMAVIDIANKHGVRDHNVRKVLKKSGITLLRRFRKDYSPHNKTNVEEELILKLAKSGMSFPDIAKKLKCSVHVVRQRSYAKGIKSPGFSFKEATNLKSILGEEVYNKLYDRDWLFDQYVIKFKPTRVIATEIGCGKKAVSTALKKHKIQLRSNASKGVFHSNFSKCKKFHFDSYWEYTIACRLDEDKLVDKFINEPFPISYVDKNRTRKYYPDFLVFLNDGRTFLLEVKPNRFLKAAEQKTQAAFNSQFPFFIINEKDMFPWE